MNKTFYSELNQNKCFKLHNLFFGGIIFTLGMVIMQNMQFSFQGWVQSMYKLSGFQFWDWTIPSVDYAIPIIPFFWIIYGAAIASWTILPIFLYMTYGPKRFAKYLTCCMYAYAFAILIAVCTPCDLVGIQNYALSELQDKTGFLIKQTRDLIKNNVTFDAFPSNHCLNQFDLMFGFILFNFFDKTNRKDSKKILTWKIIWTSLISIFTILVAASTFIMKVHFFVDWIPSLIVSLSVFVIMYFVKTDPVTRFFYKLMNSFQYCFWYVGPNEVNNDIWNWAKIHQDPFKINALSKKEIKKHFIITDIVIFSIYLFMLLILNYCLAALEGFDTGNRVFNFLLLRIVIYFFLIDFLIFGVYIFHTIYKKQKIKQITPPTNQN